MAHHLLVFANPTIAKTVADELVADGFDAVSTERGTDGSTEVSIDDARLPVKDGSAAVEGLRTRFQALADEHQGQYVESQPDEAGDAGSGGGGGSW